MEIKSLIRVFLIAIKYLLGVLELFFALFVLYGFLALVGMSIRVNKQYEKVHEGIKIFIRTDGIHTDFLFPVKTAVVDWTSHFPVEDLRDGIGENFSYLAIGWGDQGFFLNTPTWAELKVSTAFDALFYRGKSAIHVVYQEKPIENRYCIELEISKNEYASLKKYVLQVVKKNKSNRGNVIPMRGYWGNDAFYEANGKYSLFSTCNSFINGGLKTANLPACLWTPVSFPIFSKYESL